MPPIEVATRNERNQKSAARSPGAVMSGRKNAMRVMKR